MSGLRERLAALLSRIEQTPRHNDPYHVATDIAADLRALLAEDETPATPDDVETPRCDHDSHFMTEDDGHDHWRCLRCGTVTECNEGCTPAMRAGVRLADVLHAEIVRQNPGHADWTNCPDDGPCHDDAQAILASDWLADRLAAARREGADAALAPVKAEILRLNADADYLVPKRYLGDCLRTALAQGRDAAKGGAS